MKSISRATLDRALFYSITVFLLVFPFLWSTAFPTSFIPVKTFALWAFTEIVFVAWLYMVLVARRYSVSLSGSSVALVGFLLAYTLAGVLGVDFNTSFWGLSDRLTGIFTWMHIVLLFFVAVSVLGRSMQRWRRVLQVLALTGVVLSLLIYVGYDGWGWWITSSIGGGTMGNSSFAGMYLLFPFFSSVYLWITAGKRKARWAYAAGTLFVYFSPMFFNFKLLSGEVGFFNIFTNPLLLIGEARAATVGLFVGLALMGVLYLMTQAKKAWKKRAGMGLLALGVLLGVMLVVGFVHPEGALQDFFRDQSGESRLLFWQTSIESFKDNPVLGVGPENYLTVFYEYFEPKVYTGRYQSVVRVDKPHNMPLEILVTGGAGSFIFYLGIIVLPVVLMWYTYSRRRHEHFWFIAMLTAALVAYHMQNLMNFDVVPSLVMLTLFLAGAEAFSVRRELAPDKSIGRRTSIAVVGVAGVLMVALLVWGTILPARKLHAFRAQLMLPVAERIEHYPRLSAMSSFAEVGIWSWYSSVHTRGLVEIIQSGEEDTTGLLADEAEVITVELEDLVERHPRHYEPRFRLVQLAAVHYLLEDEFGKKLLIIERAEEHVNKLLELYPKNPPVYWAAAQLKLYRGDYDAALKLAEQAAELDPEVEQSQAMIKAVKDAIIKALQMRTGVLNQ